jgi:hypothetical protein
MKSLISALILASSIGSVFAQTIIFEEQTTTTRKLTIINGGMEIKYGQTPIAVPMRAYSAGRVRIGDNVITSDNRAGKVQSVFVAQQKIVVADSYYGNRTFSLDKIAVTQGCVNSICVDDKVVTSDNRDGKVAGYFSDGRVVVSDSYYGYRTFSQDNVALSLGCTELFCVGDSVITSDNRNGKVTAFFGDGRITVADSFYGNRTFSEENVSVTSGVCTNIYTHRVNFCN